MGDDLKGFMFPRFTSRIEYNKASDAIAKYMKTLSEAGVEDYIIGTRYGKPYILVLIKEGKVGDLPKSIPDMLDGCEVFYKEFNPK
jgi:hypothetical protein